MVRKDSLKKPKVAIYIRVSTEEQAREGFSLSAQESALKDYVGMIGYDIYKVYRDEGISAKDMKHRPALQQLLKDAERKMFRAICVYKLDRFSRSLKDLILTIELLKNLNIDFISLQDKIETASASGKLMFHIISSFAEFERDIISERTKFGMSEKAKEGGIVTKAAYGYKNLDGKIILDPDKKDRLVKIFETYLNTTTSLGKLAKSYDLTAKGLISILRNRIYIGELRFNKKYTKAQHEQLLSKELFDNVQSKLDGASLHRNVVKYTNLIKRLGGSNISMEFIEKFVSCLSKKTIRLNIRIIHVDSDDDFSKIPEPKTLKLAGKKYLLEQGFSEDEISFDRVFVNATRADVTGMNAERKTYLYYTPKSVETFLDLLSEDVDVGFLKGEQDITVYMFTKEQEF